MFIFDPTDMLKPPSTPMGGLAGLGEVSLTPAQQKLYDLLSTIPGEGRPDEVRQYVSQLGDVAALYTLAVRQGYSAYPSQELAIKAGRGDEGVPTRVAAEYLRQLFQVPIFDSRFPDLANPPGGGGFVVPWDYASKQPWDKAKFVFGKIKEGFTEQQILSIIQSTLGPQADWPEVSARVAGLQKRFAIPPGFAYMNTADKAQFYLDRLAEGFGEDQIRRILEEDGFFRVSDAEWAQITGLAAEMSAPPPIKLPPGTRLDFEVPLNIPQRTPQEKAQFYLDRINEGFTNEQIRRTIELVFGTQPDDAWNALRALAAQLQPPGYVPPVTPTVMPLFDIPADLGQRTPQQKAQFYLDRINEGFTNEQIRKTVEAVLGTQPDDAWNALRSLAAEIVAANDPVAKAAAAAAAAAKAAADAAAKAAADAAKKDAADAAAKAAAAAAAKAAADAAAKAAADAAAKAAADAAAKTGQTNLGPLLLAVAAAYFLGA